MDTTESRRPEVGHIASRISREIVQVHAELYGRGPTRAKTHVAADYVLCVLEEVFTRAENTLVRAGNAKQVETNRQAFQEAVESELVSIVETATGRSVRAFVSQVHIETDLSVELFMLDPEPGGTDRGEQEQPDDI